MVGAGIVGLTTALVLEEQGHTVRIVAADVDDTDGIAALEKAEQRAHRDRYLSIRPGRDGHSGQRSVDGRWVRPCRWLAMITHWSSRAS